MPGMALDCGCSISERHADGDRGWCVLHQRMSHRVGSKRIDGTKPRILYHGSKRCPWLVEVPSPMGFIVWDWTVSFERAVAAVQRFYAELPRGEMFPIRVWSE